MVVNSSVSDTPRNDDRRVWRYITFHQLISILDREELYFSSIDTFQDRFEGSFPKEESIESNYSSYVSRLEESGQASDPTSFAENVKNYRIYAPKIVFANCWHINDRETAFMWNQYQERSIAIQSTVSRLRDSFSISKRGAQLYEVEYIDYEEEEFQSEHRLAAYFHKRRSFEHENELRIMYLGHPPQAGCESDVEVSDTDGFDLMASGDVDESMFVEGQFHEFDVDSLVENIYVDPRRSDEFLKLTQNAISKYSFDFPVTKSELSKDPVY
jgi:hypothetical protein